MVSIHTNLSSIIAQRSMTKSTNLLNQAIERMSTGYKINHAADNAANYSISQNINAQMSSYDIAADNISMGMDLLKTAQDTIAGMQDRGSRLQAILTQARNGTYGASSLSALTSEANALVSEINRLYINTEYNGKQLFEIPLPDWAKEVKANAGLADGEAVGTLNNKSLAQCAAENNGFISEVVCDTPEVTIYSPADLANAIDTKTIIGIGNAETLAELANLVNGTSTLSPEVTKNCSGKTIVLMNDVDLSAICAANTDPDGNGGWNPIGSSVSKSFKGIFNGNGHKVTGLYIKRTDASYQGLFGYATGELKNIWVEGEVTGASNTGGLAGSAGGGITNSYATGNVTGTGNSTGGLAGYARETITNSYATGTVTGQSLTGGLAGWAGGAITNSYATGTVTGESTTGGLAGSATGAITNSYATGNVTGTSSTGGLAGIAQGAISNSYATGTVTGQSFTGGLAGRAQGAISNSYATGTVTGQSFTGGLAGRATGAITNSYATGNVTGHDSTGGLAGSASKAITNSYATGNVTGESFTGGLAGRAIGAIGAITNSYATGNVAGTEWVGGLIGQLHKTSESLTNEFILSSGQVSGSAKVGSLIGGIVDTSNGSNFATINITDAFAHAGMDMIGFEGKDNGTAYSSGQMESWLENITAMEFDTSIQVGINGDSASQIKVDTTFNYNLNIYDITSDRAFNSVTEFLNKLNSKATELGAAQNRLESALESTTVSMDNLTSSLSTIRDADIAKVSSQYIRQQILQQAAATLMSTANQSPAIALQLI